MTLTAAFAALVILFIACSTGGRPANGFDAAVAAQAAATRAASPFLLQASLFITNAGGAPITLGLATVGALVLASRRGTARVVILLVTVVATRLAVEGLKLFFGRVRPAFDTQLVQVHSLSFPSAHSANSLTTYVLLACFLASGRFRPAAVTIAFAIAFTVGFTRILLGVHWLSDVIGGWAAGLFAVLLAFACDRRLGAQEQ